MPTPDRKPRRRVRQNAPEQSYAELMKLARNATPSDWDAGLRRSLTRALVARGHTQAIAEGIARAYERRPELMPQNPPPGASL